MSPKALTRRTQIRRHAERGHYDRETVDQILDAAFHGHLALVADGQPYAVPMLYVRNGDELYLHGSPRSGPIRAAVEGGPLSFTVTMIDGLVLARAAFTHSVNYRSVVVFGRGRAVRDRTEKLEAMTMLVEHIVPGRPADARGPNEKELKSTEILALTISESSAKVRTGPPKDTEKDLDMPIWAGVLPLQLVAGEPLADEYCRQPAPGYLTGYRI